MRLQLLEATFAVCKLADGSGVEGEGTFLFLARTDREWSLVCEEERIPAGCLAVEPGWRALRVAETLDFSLTGVLAGLASCLADAGVPLFALSTYDTDYLLVKGNDLERAAAALTAAGYRMEDRDKPSDGG